MQEHSTQLTYCTLYGKYDDIIYRQGCKDCIGIRSCVIDAHIWFNFQNKY